MADIAADDPRHGTVNGYANLKCRCDRCRAAWTYFARRRRAQGIPVRPVGPQAEHGSLKRYRKWGCRCELCRRASAVHRAKFRRVSAIADSQERAS